MEAEQTMATTQAPCLEKTTDSHDDIGIADGNARSAEEDSTATTQEPCLEKATDSHDDVGTADGDASSAEEESTAHHHRKRVAAMRFDADKALCFVERNWTAFARRLMRDMEAYATSDAVAVDHAHALRSVTTMIASIVAATERAAKATSVASKIASYQSIGCMEHLNGAYVPPVAPLRQKRTQM